jgi:hypothetical protein
MYSLAGVVENIDASSERYAHNDLRLNIKDSWF